MENPSKVSKLKGLLLFEHCLSDQLLPYSLFMGKEIINSALSANL